MPFPNPPHPQLREWDDRACDAAVVAQILYMGGALNIPFDTAQFDGQIKRSSRSLPTTLGGIRLLTSTLDITVAAYDSLQVEDCLDRVKARAALRAQGYKDSVITRYFEGPEYARTQGRARDELLLRQELGRRYSRTVCSDSSKHVAGLLAQGALVVTHRNTAVEHPHSVLLIPEGKKIQLFDPATGLSTTTLDKLLADTKVRLDERGFTAYKR